MKIIAQLNVLSHYNKAAEIISKFTNSTQYKYGSTILVKLSSKEKFMSNQQQWTIYGADIK